MVEPQPIPLDIKLMNFTASVVFLFFFLGLLTIGVWWLVQQPIFAIKNIVIQNDLTHISESALRSQVTNQLTGNFFTINLKKTKNIFESASWIRHVSVQRVFPNQLRVAVEEHLPLAYWGAEGASTLLNSYGEVFEGDTEDVDDDLPRLKGPNDRSAEVLDMYGWLHSLLLQIELNLDELELTDRGSWRGRLDTGAIIEFGMGHRDDILHRTRRFVRTVTEVSLRYGRRPNTLESVDLRYSDGFALRLQGITTVTSETVKP